MTATTSVDMTTREPGPTAQHLQERALRSFRTAVPDHDSWIEPDSSGSFLEPEESGAKTSPLTGLPLPRARQTDPDTMGLVYEDARRAQRAWAELSIAERSVPLRRFESLLWKLESEILDVIQWETGKPRKHAFEELLDVSMTIGYYAGKGASILRSERTPGAMPFMSAAHIAHLPLGVVGVIAPWNYPFTLAISDAVAALIAGNTVVLKPASQTTLSAIVIASLLQRSGLPPSVYQLVPGSGASIGDAIVDHSDFVMFTGSTKVGKKIAEACGERLIGCSAELGGKNPSIIFPDANLNKWVDAAARESFSSSGQLCVSIERLYIHDDIWDEAVALLVERVEGLVAGRDFAWDTDFGPLVDEAQLSGVADQVQDATSKGARILTGGSPMPELGPTGFEPTLLTDVTPDMEVFAQETFGPVVSLYRWTHLDQVVDAANDTEFGLNGSVWSSDYGQALRTARRIETGSVSINESYGATWGAVAAPIGGFGESGLGRRHGHEGLLKYTEAQTVTTGPPSLSPWFGMSPKAWAAAERTVIRARNLAWKILGAVR